MKTKGSFTKATNGRMDAMAEAYKAGQSLQQIAQSFGLTRQSVWDSLRRRGVPMRPQKREGQENHFWLGGNNKNRKQHKRAQSRVYKARKRNEIVRQPCEKCGAPAGMSQAHHDDYGKPLLVRWLCQACHHAEHYA